MHFTSQSLKTIVCPYCEKQLLITRANKEVPGFIYGILSCSCDNYPFFDNLIYLQKTDIVTNKKAVAYVKQNKWFRALSVCLIGSAKTHRVIILAALLLKIKHKKIISRFILLNMLGLFGRSFAWFQYLNHRAQKNIFNSALAIIKNKRQIQPNIVDFGCGSGTLLSKLSDAKLLKSAFYFGIDKSFLSLCLAYLYHTNVDHALWICADVESTPPIKRNKANFVFLIDTFPWILGKPFFVERTKNILRRNGSINILEMRAEHESNFPWGYGMTPKTLLHIAKKNKLSISFFDHNNLDHKTSALKVNSLNYTAILSR